MRRALLRQGLAQAAQPVHSGHVVIQQHQIKRSLPHDQTQRAIQIGGCMSLDPSGRLDKGHQRIAQQIMVVGNQNFQIVSPRIHAALIHQRSA